MLPIIYSYITGGLSSSAGAATCGSTVSTSLTLPNVSSSELTGTPWRPATGDAPITQPYYLEEYAIAVLEDLATKLNVPSSQTVTQEHVIALIGWFWYEKGNISTDPDFYNLLNLSNGSGGFETYSSFGAGVEATTDQFLESYQNRIGAIFAMQNSTAEDVAAVIGNYQNYNGNLSWSVPSEPDNATPTPAQIVAYNQTTYIPILDSSIEQARTSYNTEATLEIGPPGDQYANEAKYSVSSSILTYSQNSTPPTGITTISSTTPVTDSSDSGSCVSSVSCNSSSPTTSSIDTTNLSTIRQQAVCIAVNELTEHWSGGPPFSTSTLDYFTTYTEGRHEQWCADFLSWVYNQAGYPISGSSSDWDWSGVSEIQTSAQNGGAFTWHSVAGYTPQPGDLAILSAPGNPDYHVEMVVSVNGPTITYIAGDTGGPFPNDPNGYGYGGTASPNPPGSQSESYVSETTSQADIAGYASPN